jgi:hypothetical protein
VEYSYHSFSLLLGLVEQYNADSTICAQNVEIEA